MKTFTKTKIHQGIRTVLEGRGIKKTTPVQEETIPLLLKHKGDFVCRAATGTGKTFAFGIPLLQRIEGDKKQIQALIIVPTRELCEQMGKEMQALSAYMKDVHVAAIYGGISLKSQTKDLTSETQVLIATPGRLMDLIERKLVDLAALQYCILDEADKMLLTGFKADIDKILTNVKTEYTTWLFSATMPEGVHEIIETRLTNDLKHVEIGDADQTNDGISHEYLELIPEQKLNVLLHYLEKYSGKRSIVFCRTKSGVQKLYKQLSANKFKSGAIHGDLPQGLRNKVMTQFKDGNIDILLATDVASRGVDVEDISHVIQYHLAETRDSYLHRTGRTSRAGKTGTAITFVFEEEKKKLLEIQEELNFELAQIPLPSPQDQLINRAVLWARKVAKEKPIPGELLPQKQRDEFRSEIEHLSTEELAEKLMAVYLRENQG
ncbi:MAG: DEAD/DEAH box helicase [Flavobacteriales bacterium]